MVIFWIVQKDTSCPLQEKNCSRAHWCRQAGSVQTGGKAVRLGAAMPRGEHPGRCPGRNHRAAASSDQLPPAPRSGWPTPQAERSRMGAGSSAAAQLEGPGTPEQLLLRTGQHRTPFWAAYPYLPEGKQLGKGLLCTSNKALGYFLLLIV